MPTCICGGKSKKEQCVGGTKGDKSKQQVEGEIVKKRTRRNWGKQRKGAMLL